MLWFYLDESGIHDRDSNDLNRLIIGGGMTTLEEWQNLSIEWSAVLQSFKIPMFHMAEFEARKKPFDRFNNEQRRDLLNRLLEIALRHIPVFYGVVDEPFGQNHGFRDRYQSIALKLFGEINILSRTEPVTIILARHKNISNKRTDKWQNLWLYDKSFVFGGFADPEHVCALQVADIVAYEFSRHMRVDKPEKERYPLTRLKTAKYGCHLANARFLRYENL